ncbi:Fic/DOC family protein, partial [Herbiconiux ginsengi]
VASVRWAAMSREPLPERFNVAQLQAIHRRLFDEIYPFAGRLRDVDAQAMGTGIPYSRPEFIPPQARAIDDGLRRDNYLRGMPHDQFVDRLAYHWGELTALHPMRDGNTRSQSAFVTQLAAAAGYRIDWERVDVDELRTVRLQAVASSERPLASYLRDRVQSFTEHDRAAQHDAMSGLLFEQTPQGQQVRALIETQRRAFGQDPAGILRPPSEDRSTRRRRPPESRSSERGLGRR